MIERAAAAAELLLVNVEQALDRIGALITQARRDAGGTDLVNIRLERRLAEGAGRRAALGAARKVPGGGRARPGSVGLVLFDRLRLTAGRKASGNVPPSVAGEEANGRPGPGGSGGSNRPWSRLDRGGSPPVVPAALLEQAERLGSRLLSTGRLKRKAA